MKKPTQIFLLFFFLLVFLIIFIVAFWSIFPQPKANKIEYNNFEFIRKQGHWEFDWQQGNTVYTIPLGFNPKQLEDVPIRGTLNESFNRPEVYLTFDPEEGNFSVLALAATEVSLNLVRALNVLPIASCIKNVTGVCDDRPIVTCEDNNKSVILLNDKGKAGIILKGDCIVLNGANFDLLKSIDRILYQWYGVMS